MLLGRIQAYGGSEALLVGIQAHGALGVRCYWEGYRPKGCGDATGRDIGLWGSDMLLGGIQTYGVGRCYWEGYRPMGWCVFSIPFTSLWNTMLSSKSSHIQFFLN